ncbi:MAG TPA: hypothetical protein VGX37_11525 [Allosphingosinicella sp.]|jgi:hypothetical protein|nr:hypothetical protein [Allosphingosinicella sp.]
MRLQSRAFLLAGLLLAGCASTPRPAPEVTPAPAPYSRAGLEQVIGSSARALIAHFGRPDLDLREGPARKLQFLTAACVLDAYLYPPRPGAEAVVTHVDARLPDGRDMDRASCVAALNARQRTR